MAVTVLSYRSKYIAEIFYRGLGATTTRNLRFSKGGSYCYFKMGKHLKNGTNFLETSLKIRFQTLTPQQKPQKSS